MKHKHSNRDPLILNSGEGRAYNCGRMKAIFKADENETSEKYSISEWWLEPGADGPGAHKHDANDDVFYVLEGTFSIRVGEEWTEAKKRAFVRIPAGTLHDFANRTDRKAGMLNFYIPGGFEKNMPAIVKWFAENT